jgi:hypothetical protein
MGCEALNEGRGVYVSIHPVRSMNNRSYSEQMESYHHRFDFEAANEARMEDHCVHQ